MKKILYLAVMFVFIAGTAIADDLSDALGTSTGTVAGILGKFSTAGLMWGVLFSGVGVGAMIYGKKKSNAAFIVIGILLSGYTFLVQDTVMIAVVGAALCGALYFFRRG